MAICRKLLICSLVLFSASAPAQELVKVPVQIPAITPAVYKALDSSAPTSPTRSILVSRSGFSGVMTRTSHALMRGALTANVNALRSRGVTLLNGLGKGSSRFFARRAGMRRSGSYLININAGVRVRNELRAKGWRP